MIVSQILAKRRAAISLDALQHRRLQASAQQPANPAPVPSQFQVWSQEILGGCRSSATRNPYAADGVPNIGPTANVFVAVDVLIEDQRTLVGATVTARQGASVEVTFVDPLFGEQIWSLSVAVVIRLIRPCLLDADIARLALGK